MNSLNFMPYNLGVFESMDLEFFWGKIVSMILCNREARCGTLTADDTKLINLDKIILLLFNAE